MRTNSCFLAVTQLIALNVPVRFAAVILLAFALWMSSVASVAKAESVEKLLTERHLSATPAELETVAGGREQLIDELLKLRQKDTPPYLSVRAEKALLSYSSDEKVVAALESDLADPNAQGLARIVALHLNKVPSATARERLTKSIRSRAERDESFAPFLRAVESAPAEAGAK